MSMVDEEEKYREKKKQSQMTEWQKLSRKFVKRALELSKSELSLKNVTRWKTIAKIGFSYIAWIQLWIKEKVNHFFHLLVLLFF